MEATLLEILPMGRIIEKEYSIQKGFKYKEKEYDNLTLEYNQEKNFCKVKLDDSLVYKYDFDMSDKLVFDLKLDKKIIKQAFGIVNVYLDKECMDYPELIELN